MRTFFTILATALVVAPATAVTSAAIGGDTRRAVAPSTLPKPEPKGNAPANMRVNCFSLRCINRNLTKLKKDAFGCERLADLTSYNGYVYNTGTAETITSALDLTEPGAVPTATFVTYVC